MSNFEVLVYKINEPLQHHPNADRLSLVQIQGYTCVSAKNEDGSHRYNVGDLVVYVPEDAIVTEQVMKDYGFWDETKDRGGLRGSGYNRVRPMRLRGIYSQGILLDIRNKESFVHMNVNEGDNLAEYFGITKYEPSVPKQMAGQHGAFMSYTMSYDFDSIQKNPRLFEKDQLVSVTEKIHGTLIQIGYIPGLKEEKFFGDGDIFVTSKGISKRGFVLINTPENENNLYVKVLKNLLDNTDFYAKIRSYAVDYGNACDECPCSIHLFGEVFGVGIQDLGYGFKEPQLRIFDVAINKEYQKEIVAKILTHHLDLQLVPTLYKGPYDLKELEKYRDGTDTYSGSHVREGIVIKAVDGSYHPKYGRKIAKWISPDYELRKGNKTDFT